MNGRKRAGKFLVKVHHTSFLSCLRSFFSEAMACSASVSVPHTEPDVRKSACECARGFLYVSYLDDSAFGFQVTYF